MKRFIGMLDEKTDQNISLNFTGNDRRYKSYIEIMVFRAIQELLDNAMKHSNATDVKLGLDLSGGIELDYKVDLTEAQQEEDYNATRKNAIVEGLKSIIDKRVETLNINDSVITSASYGSEEHIIVQIPLK